MAIGSERLQFEEDIVVGENTLNFDVATLEEMTAHQFNLECLNVSPTLMGEPVERRRLYICMLRKGKRRWRHELLRQGLGETWQEVFEAVFQRNIVMTAADKFRAPALGVKNYIAKLAEQQHLPKNTRSGKDWSCFQAVSRAVRDKIQAHQEELARKLLSADLDSGLAATADDPLELRHWTSNVAQQPHFMGPVRGNVPAMLQHTNLWIFGKRRLALPMEHLEIQGWNIYGNFDNPYRSNIFEVVSSMRDSRLKSFAGNGMHCQVVGAVTAFLLAATEDVTA